MWKERSKLIIDPTRRDFLRKSFAGMGWMMAGTTLSQCASEDAGTTTSNIANLGPLQAPDENGLRLPAGFSSQSCMPISLGVS